jgi:hypothetical protein
VWPERPDRAYVGYIDGGAFILDISGLAGVRAGRERNFSPTVVGQVTFSPPYTAWTHTFQPIFSRGLALASDEAVRDNCEDMPKLVWLVDIRAESHPVIIDTAPLHANDGERARQTIGAHNLHPRLPNATSANLRHTTVASHSTAACIFPPPTVGRRAALRRTLPRSATHSRAAAGLRCAARGSTTPSSTSTG